ncbi:MULTISPECIES: hypothetical protein [Photobacterium]|jgi:cytochrome c556|uniref:Conjugal transfer protein n=1 Tax=Photobacterium carnosum TaxID=2023717 RepID=A0A2N4UPV4_9GAMM|nr:MULTISPECIES: hypothetical protein [Photobacterium]MBY3789414.1 hypothetical protein [Photobacterium carnosum]MCD9463308.1 hypothetical protein [Photobacterium phosphoreum]MCD9480702.1 hypothetical protein [Photobacterium phosphoreum]MCD9502115.1 hypothetical protein [Photobacterium phosphoreum]MCD9512286.1 hypothetical protein [Photobacterium phosphoreum]
MKMKTAVLALLLVCSSTSALAAHDRGSLRPNSQRERIGLQTVSTQLAKINELATASQASANTRAKAQFNYAKFQNEILKLQKQVDDFLYRPLQPVPVSVLDNGGSQFQG